MNNLTISGNHPGTEEQYLETEGCLIETQITGNGNKTGETKIYTGEERGIKNVTPFTKAEAEEQARKLEQKFKEVVKILGEIGYLIEEMDRRKGWGELGYKDYTEWACGRLDCEKSFAYLYKKAAAFDVRSLESGDPELIQFAQQSAIKHKAILQQVPKGKEKQAIQMARELASVEGKNATADHYKRAVDDILSRGIDEENQKILTDETIEYNPWRKAKDNSNAVTLEAVLPYWERLREERSDDERERNKAERRIRLIKERLEKLNKKGKGNSNGSQIGGQQVREEIPELVRAITEEYLKDLPSDDARAAALIGSVEGEDERHINAIAEQFPLNQREEAIAEIGKVLKVLHNEYIQSVLEEGHSDSNASDPEGQISAADEDAFADSDNSSQAETTGELQQTTVDVTADEDAFTDSDNSSQVETTGELQQTTVDVTADDEDTFTDSDDSSQAETTGELQQTTVDVTADEDAFADSDDSSQVETTGERQETTGDVALDGEDTFTGSDDSSPVETTGELQETIFECKTAEELKTYINGVSLNQIWDETQDLYKDWNRLSEKVGNTETKLEEKTIECKELERKLREKDAELKEQERLIQQLRSIVASLEEELKEYRSADSSRIEETEEEEEF